MVPLHWRRNFLLALIFAVDYHIDRGDSLNLIGMDVPWRPTTQLECRMNDVCTFFGQRGDTASKCSVCAVVILTMDLVSKGHEEPEKTSFVCQLSVISTNNVMS
jgi:hypothetical protein